MKRFNWFSLLLGIGLGILLGALLPQTLPLVAQDPAPKAEALSAEEMDKRLDEILESQKGLMTKLESVTTQSQFLKASAGK